VREAARDILDTIIFIIIGPFIFVGLLCFIIFLLAQFALEWILEHFFNYTPKWVHASEDPWRDIYCYGTGNDENGKSYIEISTANGGEENETTYPIAKDFIARVFSPYNMLVRIEGNESFVVLYHRFLSEYRTGQSFLEKNKEDKSMIYILCDDIKPVFEMLSTQSEYSYYFDVCAFASTPHVESYEDAEKLMADKGGLLYIERRKQHDEILLYFDESVFSEADLLKTFRECCEEHDRRFMTSEEIEEMYP